MQQASIYPKRLASQATALVIAETEPSVVPRLDIPHTMSQCLAPELVQSLVSTVSAEVTRQLTVTLPALASQLRPQPPLATRNLPNWQKNLRLRMMCQPLLLWMER